MQYQDIRDGDGVPWRDKTGRHKTFAPCLEEGESDSSIDTTILAQSATGATDVPHGKLSMDRRGKVICRTEHVPLSGAGAVEMTAPSNRIRECYKCVHIDVENPDGSPGDFLSFPPYSAPGGLQELMFPEQYHKSSTSLTSPTSTKQDHAFQTNSSSEATEIIQLDESTSSLNGVLESSTEYLMKTFRRLGLVAGASLLRFGDLSVYEEAHFSAGGELNDCADLTHLGGCGCFEEQKRLYQLRLEALETTKGHASSNIAVSNSASTSLANADKARQAKKAC